MKTSPVISAESQEHFWRVVQACLREFHHDLAAAQARLTTLRQEVEESSVEDIELFFHGEPFLVACALAGQDLPVEPHLAHYLAIRDGDAWSGPTDPPSVSG